MHRTAREPNGRTDQTGPLVIGAGPGRTGTASLKIALERIGFGPCHHMEAVFRNPREVPVWEKAARGEDVDWRTFLGGWRATLDFPSALYWPAIAQAFPEAKILLSVRDPEAWYDSFRSTILAVLRRFPNRLVARHVPILSASVRSAGESALARMFPGALDDRQYMIRRYREYNEEVRAAVPKDRLLVFDVREGWAPLCAFLQVPIPRGSFPRVNDTATFRRRTAVMTAICWVLLFSPPVTWAVARDLRAR